MVLQQGEENTSSWEPHVAQGDNPDGPQLQVSVAETSMLELMVPWRARTGYSWAPLMVEGLVFPWKIPLCATGDQTPACQS